MNIALIEDDINLRKSLEGFFATQKEFNLKVFKNAKDALKGLNDNTELIITDINMGKGMDGIELLKELDGKYESIVITGNATIQRTIDAMRYGAKDFIQKPFEPETLIKAIKRSLKAQQIIRKVTSENTSNNTSKEHQGSNKEFFGTSENLEKSLSMVRKVACTNASVLLLGESGVGKELFANYVHNQSDRKNKPFIAINMAAIPDTLLESELFGFEKGAFTDAKESRAGKFEEADGGTIFLDEIGEMPMNLQAKLLRVLQEKEVTKIGSSKPTKIDIRVVSATNANLQTHIKNGDFREDLYYRLNTIPINIAPLRERTDEILEIAQKTLENTCKKYSLENKNFSDNAKQELLKYNWPGNIRELVSVVERATLLSDEIIEKENLFLEPRDSRASSIENTERKLIKEVLDMCNNDLVCSAKELGMSQTIFKKKLAKHKIEI
jgi:two-component system NtrC family response regulator/two-component system response regulator FlrC